PCDLLGPAGNFGQGGQPDVRQAQVGREHRPGDIDPVEALVLDQVRAERVERAGETEQLPAGEPLPEAGAFEVGGGGGVQHQKIPPGALTEPSSPAGAVMVNSPSSSLPRCGRRWATSRKRVISPSSSTPSARMRNLFTYCSRPKGRAP